ncbi:MAG: four helix bundle protein [Candidatus Edwardsbacteria bacterium]
MTYEDLEVFKLVHQLVIDVYRIVKKFPEEERFRLCDQICRSTSSIPANIAEGYGRFSLKERIQFLYISRGSVEELKYHLLLAKDLSYISITKFEELRSTLDITGRMLNGLITSIKNAKKPRYQETRKLRNQDIMKP